MSKPSYKLPRVCIVGPMLGKRNGFMPSMGEALADLLSEAGYDVVTTSRCINRAVRFVDKIATIATQARSTEIQVLQVYAGLSLVVEDAASWLGRQLGQKVIMHLHGGAMPDYVVRHPAWARRILRRADVLVSPSPYLARTMARLGLPTRVIPNVLDLSSYPFRLRRRLAPRLFWMRAFHPIYDPAMALRVLARLRRGLPDTTLVMAGPDKGGESGTRALAAELGVANAVRFVGFLNKTAKTREMDDADIFINTSRIDNAPVTVLEACAMGLPVVSTNVGGIPDLLCDGRTGLLVPADDADRMAAAVLRLLGTPSLAARLSTEGRKLAEECDVKRVISMWQELLAQVMAVGR